MITPPPVNLFSAIGQIIAEGWQVSAVWIVPSSSNLSRSKRTWEAHITRPDFPFGDEVIQLPPMSEEQAEAIAAAIHKAGDASATHLTSSGCFAIGPTAAWCREPLRQAIFAVRN